MKKLVEDADKFKRIIITERVENCNQTESSKTNAELIKIFRNRGLKSKSKFYFPSLNKKLTRSKSTNSKILCLCDYSKDFIRNQSVDELDIHSQKRNKLALNEIDKKVFNWYDEAQKKIHGQSMVNMSTLNQDCFANKPRSVSRVTTNGVECCDIRSFQEVNCNLGLDTF